MRKQVKCLINAFIETDALPKLPALSRT